MVRDTGTIMSLLHSITSMRAMALNSVYEDIERAWPNGARFSHHDIAIGRRSLTETAQERGTPYVLVTPVERPHSVAPIERYRSLVVARILSISPRRSWLHPTEITIDCSLEALDSRVLDTALLSNPNPWRRRPVIVRSQDGQLQLKLSLPASTDRGHLVVFACAGTLTLGQVDPKGLETPPLCPLSTRKSSETTSHASR